MNYAKDGLLLYLKGTISDADEGTEDELHDIGTAARTSYYYISLLHRMS